jgi:hypothetical protein
MIGTVATAALVGPDPVAILLVLLELDGIRMMNTSAESSLSRYPSQEDTAVDGWRPSRAVLPGAVKDGLSSR